MKEVTITTAPVRRSKSSAITGETREGWYAVVANEGASLSVSRFDDESGWTVDSASGLSGFPYWVNGFGAREVLTHRLSPEAAQVLDEAVAS